MDYLIKNIVLDKSFDKYKKFNIEGVEEKYLNNLSKINIFVGANNSGKSRFMRLLSAIEKIQFSPAFDLQKIETLKYETKMVLQKFGSERDYSITELMKQLDNKYQFLEESTEHFGDVIGVFEKVYTAHAIGISRRNINGQMEERDLKSLRETLSPLHEKYKTIISEFPKSISFKNLYIPALRGLRTFNNQNCYKERTLKDYFQVEGKKFQPDIFTGLELYETIRNHLLGNLEEREVVVEFQEFLSKTFFEGKSIALIPRKDSDVLFVKIGSEPEFPVHNLGDGIQSIVILTFPLFLSRHENLLAFIEEPEIYMHPGLQRIYLNTLFKFENHQFFFTTHSNHFLDLTLDYENISIFAFNKKLNDTGNKVISANFEIHNVSNESRKPLELLGVKNSSVFLTNCTIWVEGITDRRYIAHYLNKYQEKLKDEPVAGNLNILKEDMHYSFVEYSGSNITHWSFLEDNNSINVDRLCGTLFLIADKDDAEKKDDRHKKLQAKLGNRYYRLNAREIENLLAPHVLKLVIQDYEGDAAGIPDFEFSNYADKPLGKFIDNLLGEKRKRKGKYSSESGTITDKVNFCEKALRNIKTFDDISDEAKDLSKRIFEFIKSMNS